MAESTSSAAIGTEMAARLRWRSAPRSQSQCGLEATCITAEAASDACSEMSGIAASLGHRVQNRLLTASDEQFIHRVYEQAPRIFPAKLDEPLL
jgi:hypothetical protein